MGTLRSTDEIAVDIKLCTGAYTVKHHIVTDIGICYGEAALVYAGWIDIRDVGRITGKWKIDIRIIRMTISMHLPAGGWKADEREIYTAGNRNC